MNHLFKILILLLLSGHVYSGDKDFLYHSAIHMFKEKRCDIGSALLEEWTVQPMNSKALRNEKNSDFLEQLNTAMQECSSNSIFKNGLRFFRGSKSRLID